MEENILDNIDYPELLHKINEWSFKFKYEFYKQVECFLSSGIMIDYISAKLIKLNKLALISTKPPVELNIINSPLFVYDKSYSFPSFSSNKSLLWFDAFDKDKFYELKYKKMDIFGFTSAISLYTQNKDQRISISFATERKENNINDYYLGNIKYLHTIANFVEKITFPMFSEIFSTKLNSNSFSITDNLNRRSKIFLAINNI